METDTGAEETNGRGKQKEGTDDGERKGKAEGEVSGGETDRWRGGTDRQGRSRAVNGRIFKSW